MNLFFQVLCAFVAVAIVIGVAVIAIRQVAEAQEAYCSNESNWFNGTCQLVVSNEVEPGWRNLEKVGEYGGLS